jgi:hypothetical protein
MTLSAGTPTSGNKGRVHVTQNSVKTEMEITKWSRRGEADTDSYATSSSNSRKRSLPGNSWSTGSVEGKRSKDSGRQIEQVLEEGQQVGLELIVSEDDGGGYDYDSVTIKNLNIDVDVDGGAAVSFSFDWEENSAPTVRS